MSVDELEVIRIVFQGLKTLHHISSQGGSSADKRSTCS
jgi:hypothetical protein